MKPLLLTDLDDTLLQSARKMTPDTERIPISQREDGTAGSFMYPWQRDFVDWALVQMHVIPITARGIPSYQRIQIPFQNQAVCMHGAVILNANQALDRDWHAHMQSQLAPYQTRLATLLQHIEQQAAHLALPLRFWLESIEELAVYVVVKSNRAMAEDLQAVLQALQAQAGLLEGFYIHQNDNNLALLPLPVAKRNAAQAIISRHTEQYGRVPILGWGDSLSDLGFMQLCDWAAYPPQSQIGEHVYDDD